MQLNCKKGDLAMVVKGTSRRIRPGMVVQCLEFVPAAMDVDSGEIRENVWRVDLPAPASPGSSGWAVEDSRLRPLRNPGDDEVDSRDIKLGEAMRTQVPVGADA